MRSEGLKEGPTIDSIYGPTEQSQCFPRINKEAWRDLEGAESVKLYLGAWCMYIHVHVLHFKVYVHVFK